MSIESTHACGTVHHLEPLWRRAGTKQVLLCSGRVAGLGWDATSPTFAHVSTKGRSESGLGNYLWVGTMLTPRLSMSFTVVTGTVIDVG